MNTYFVTLILVIMQSGESHQGNDSASVHHANSADEAIHQAITREVGSGEYTSYSVIVTVVGTSGRSES